MNKRVKAGNFYLELPEQIVTAVESDPGKIPLQAEHPITPEALEQPQYIYRPNDPFGSAVDQAHAVASINTSHKLWVRRTWFILFVVGPLVYGELAALMNAIGRAESSPIKAFLMANVYVLPMWLIYCAIWRKALKR